jgi:peroxiredoxin
MRRLAEITAALLVSVSALPGCEKKSVKPTVLPDKPPAQRSRGGLKVGRVAPDIRFPDLDGKMVRLSDYRGKVVLLHFWASWCPLCQHMFYYHRALRERYPGKPLVFLGVSVENEPAKARAALRHFHSTMRCWSVARDRRGKISKRWKLNSIPTDYILDARGVIRYRQDDHYAVRRAQCDRIIAALLKEAEKQRPAARTNAP